jgi:hypothetical protein
MAHHDCRLGDVQRQSADGWGNWGFAVLPDAAGGPVVSLTYETEAEARAAHDLMAKVIVGAAITPHPSKA